MTGRAVAALCCGVLAALAYPPVGAWPLLLLAVAGLALLARSARSLRQGATIGLVAGLGFFPLVLWWERVVAPEAYVALVALQAASWALLGAGLTAVSRLRAWPLWSAAVWVAVELLRSSLPFGGFPWARLAFGVTGSPMLGLAALGGAPGTSAAVALSGTLLAAAAVVAARRPGRSPGRPPGRSPGRPPGRPPWRRAAAVSGSLAGAAALVLAGAAVPQPSDGPRITVAAVQGGVPAVGVEAFGPPEQVLRNHVAVTADLAARVRAGLVPAPAFAVWPENASDLDPFTSPGRELIDAAVRDVGVPVLVGAVTYPTPTTRENLGVVWDPRTGPGERYVKQALVPFGEYVPFRSLLGGVSGLDRYVPRDAVPGDAPGVLDIAGTRVGDLICFEVAFDRLARAVVDGGAQLLVVQTNNATYGGTAQPQQQWEITRLRAVEHGRAVVVAATSGTSGVIAPDGTVVRAVEQPGAALVVESVPLRGARTVADRLGPWPELLVAGAAVLAVALGIRRGRRRVGRQRLGTVPALAPDRAGADR